MEQWKESLLIALDERFDAVFAELTESSTDVRKAVERQREVSVLVRNHPQYDDGMKQLVDIYFEAMQLLLGEYGKHLYIQGAKDCIAVQRKLGIIK